MPAALALAQIIIPLLPTIAGDIAHLVAWIQSVRSAAKQSGEWTVEMDQSFRNALIATGREEAYQLDAK